MCWINYRIRVICATCRNLVICMLPLVRQNAYEVCIVFINFRNACSF